MFIIRAFIMLIFRIYIASLTSRTTMCVCVCSVEPPWPWPMIKWMLMLLIRKDTTLYGGVMYQAIFRSESHFSHFCGNIFRT